MRFEESGLFFAFSDAWEVRPFDDHEYYRWVSGLGVRGVDFVGIYQDKLVLLEVKNYRRRAGMGASDAFQAVRDNPEAFAEKMSEKVSGSIRCMRAVNSSYQRRWWFSWFERLPDRWKRRSPRSYFWYTVAEMTHDTSNCIFILWLEADTNTQATEQKLQQRLREILKEKVKQVVITGPGRPTFFEQDLIVEAVRRNT